MYKKSCMNKYKKMKYIVEKDYERFLKGLNSLFKCCFFLIPLVSESDFRETKILLYLGWPRIQSTNEGHLIFMNASILITKILLHLLCI